MYMREWTRIVVEKKQGSGVVNVLFHGFMETAKVMHHQYLAFSCPLCPVLLMAPIFLDTITYHPLGMPYVSIELGDLSSTSHSIVIFKTFQVVQNFC